MVPVDTKTKDRSSIMFKLFSYFKRVSNQFKYNTDSNHIKDKGTFVFNLNHSAKYPTNITRKVYSVTVE